MSRQELGAGSLDIVSYPLGSLLRRQSSDERSSPSYGMSFKVCPAAWLCRRVPASLFDAANLARLGWWMCVCACVQCVAGDTAPTGGPVLQSQRSSDRETLCKCISSMQTSCFPSDAAQIETSGWTAPMCLERVDVIDPSAGSSDEIGQNKPVMLLRTHLLLEALFGIRPGPQEADTCNTMWRPHIFLDVRDVPMQPPWDPSLQSHPPGVSRYMR